MNDSSKQQHCIVVGAGTVGSCIAWHLVQSGHQVTLIDREMPGQATSFGNAACISPSHVVPFSYPGVWKKIPGWLRDELGPLTIRWRHLPWLAPWLLSFWRHGNEAQVRKSASAQTQLMNHVSDDFHALLEQAGLSHYLQSKGLIVLYDHPDMFEADRWSYEMEEEYGFPWEHLGRQELKIMAPAIDLKEGLALYIPSWEHTLDPGKMTAAIADSAVNGGADWIQEEVKAVTSGSGSATVTLSSGKKVQGDRLVIAAGPWSNQLAGQLDYTVPMTPKRGYHSMIGQPGIDLDYPVMSGNRMFVMTPLAEGLRLAGTAEFARLDAEPNYRRARVLQEHARYYFPDLQLGEVSEWMGQRPMMVDSIPVISPSPSRPEVIYAFGHGHYGLTQGATTGRLVAEMINGSKASLDMSPYRFDRFRR